MLDRLKQLFIDAPVLETDDSASYGVTLAAATLLMEVIRADHRVDAVEEAHFLQTLRSDFGLQDEDVAALDSEARASQRDAISLHQFTRLINQHYGTSAKHHLLESMWKMAYADGHLHEHEEHIIRRIADLIHMSHSEFIQSKLRARDGGRRS